MKKSGTRTILAGDIGGTKTCIGLFTFHNGGAGGRLREVKVRRFVNSEYRGIEPVIDAFLEGQGPGIDAAAFGVASPVYGERCTLTNMDWVVDARRIRRRYGIGKAVLINDLVAASYGLGVLGSRDISTLQKGKKRPGNRAVIAAGTGLGEAILFWDGAGHIPSASEGGHADFAPVTRLESELLLHLGKSYGHVSYERVLSGNGIRDIYGFLRKRRGRRAPRALGKRLAAAPVITEAALAGRDRDCGDALKLFASVYGREAGNLALKAMAVNGVYVGGGIAPQVLRHPFFRKVFLKAFGDKGRFNSVLKGVPVYLILSELAALKGAAFYAMRLLSEEA